MTNKKRLLFVNDEMRMGGVARVLNTLMKSLPQDEYEIDLLVLHKEGMMLDQIPSHVHVIEGSPFFKTVDLPLKQILKEGNLNLLCSKLRLLFYMKTGLIKKRIAKERKKMNLAQYDCEFAAKEGFCTIFTAYGNAKRKLNWVLTDYSVCNYSSHHMKLLKDSLALIDLNIADSQSAMDAYCKVFDITNGIAIHNLMDVDGIQKQLEQKECHIQDTDEINLISVARFHPQKAIDRLLKASLNAHEKGYTHHLYLIGGGEMEESLKAFVKEHQMDYVTFLGYQKNPYPDMAKADLFVLSSLFEGFATVVSESLIVSTPVLSTKVSGIDEQIIHPSEGWIVENQQEALNQGLIKALEDHERLKQMKQELKTYHYPNDEILQQFMDVL